MRPGLRTTPREFECAIAVVAMTCTPAMMCLTLRRLLSLQGAGPVPTLQELLHDSVGVHFLVKFCASARRCDELIAWIEFEMFRVCEGTLLRRHQAKRLAAAYMGEQSAERIGISAPLAAAARAKVAAPSSGLTSLSFEDVQGAIEARMQTELLPRFLTSSYYRAFAANGGLGSDLGKVIGVGDFDFLRYLGAGGYGVAVLGRRKSNRRLVAIKAVDKRALIDRGKVHACFREKAALAHVNHPYILSLKYTLETEHYALFVTDYEFSGNMFADIKKGGPYPVERARLYTAQVVLAVAHLHEGGMLHRDIKVRARVGRTPARKRGACCMLCVPPPARARHATPRPRLTRRWHASRRVRPAAAARQRAAHLGRPCAACRHGRRAQRVRGR